MPAKAGAVMSDRTTHWQHVYATKGEAEVSWFQDTPAISLEMIRAASPDRNTAIIDIGGGASRLVDALLQDGYRNLAVLDLSANALDAAKERIGAAASTVDWIVADATTWQPVKSYDVWHDRAAFHFLTDPRDRAAYVERLRSAVAAGGHVIIATFAPDGPEKCSGLPVQRHDSASLSSELGPEFELVETRSDIHRTPWQSTQAFQFSRFRRRG
jgi:trans-aconitate methyltransferase